jgi:hypothetical protein
VVVVAVKEGDANVIALGQPLGAPQAGEAPADDQDMPLL